MKPERPKIVVVYFEPKKKKNLYCFLLIGDLIKEDDGDITYVREKAYSQETMGLVDTSEMKPKRIMKTPQGNKKVSAVNIKEDYGIAKSYYKQSIDQFDPNDLKKTFEYYLTEFIRVFEARLQKQKERKLRMSDTEEAKVKLEIESAKTCLETLERQ